MARFFYLDEIDEKQITTVEQLGYLAERIMALPSIKAGCAVVFGSVAWGEHTWRSDIDIADRLWEGCGNTLGWELQCLFTEIYGDEEEGQNIAKVLIDILRTEKPDAARYDTPLLSPSTRQHFALLAQVKGGVWQQFYEQIKVMQWRDHRTDIILSLGKIQELWREFQQERKSGSLYLSLPSLRVLHPLENFPKQLMRKILGEKGKLPCPDTAWRVRGSFGQLRESWARELEKLFEPFFAIDGQYRRIVELAVSDQPIGGIEYSRQTRELFANLPVEEICRIASQVYLA